MAAGVLQNPGTKYGPCSGGCEHKDCATTREWAKAQCSRCGAAVGYDVRFYRKDDGSLVHAACEEEAVEREMEAQRR